MSEEEEFTDFFSPSGKKRKRSKDISATTSSSATNLVRVKTPSFEDDVIDITGGSSEDEAPVGEVKEDSNEERLIPLRLRANSDLHNYQKETRVAETRGNKDNEKETPERWRNRLWPGKAIIAYCRIITRCTPPDSFPGAKLQLNKDQIKAHWRENEMSKVGTHFENVMNHSSTFFLLTVEESRAVR
jgi:hypothetical protein